MQRESRGHEGPPFRRPLRDRAHKAMRHEIDGSGQPRRGRARRGGHGGASPVVRAARSMTTWEATCPPRAGQQSLCISGAAAPHSSGRRIHRWLRAQTCRSLLHNGREPAAVLSSSLHRRAFSLWCFLVLPSDADCSGTE
jgi:hypothetical protein